MTWRLKQFIRELSAAWQERDVAAMRRAIEEDAARVGGRVDWAPLPPALPALTAKHEGLHDRVVYRGDALPRHEAERRQVWDNLMGFRAEARHVLRNLDDPKQPLTMFARLRQLLEE